jgi:hypothetical protein
MQIMIKLFKLAVINILIILGLLIFANLAVISIYQLTHSKLFSDSQKNKLQNKWRLPNYKNLEWAHKHFEEFAELQSEYVSYIDWRRLPYKGQTINIDEQGIRYTPQSELATEKSPLVVFLGGSSMWGTGSNDANTIPALFAQIARGRYRTVNYGEASYNAFQGYLFLKLQTINGLKPYIVIAYDGVNDADSLMPDRSPFSHPRENQIREVMKGKDRIDEEALSFNYFLLKPLKSFIARYKDHNVTYQTYEIGRENVEQKAKFLLESWMCTKRLAEANRAYFVAVLQPHAGVGKPYLNHLRLDEGNLRSRHLKLDETKLARYKIYYQVVLELLQKPEYKDLYTHVMVPHDAFDIEDYIYIDDCHVSPNGNKIMAEKIYNHINTFIGNKKKPLQIIK